MNPKKKTAQSNLTVGLLNDFLATENQTPVTKESLKLELDALVRECYGAIREPASLAGLLRNVEFYRTNLDKEMFNSLSKLADILVKDLTQFKDNLQAIEAEQNNVLSSSDDIEEIQINTFGISNQYMQWTEQYGSVVIPVAGEITAIMKIASDAAELSKSKSGENAAL